MADSMDSTNVELDSQQIYYNYATTIAQPSSITNISGDSTTVVTTINGNGGGQATGPAITLSGGATGYDFTATAGTVTLAVDNATTARAAISAAKSGINTDITELNGASQVDVSSRYEVAGIKVVGAQGAAVPDAVGGVTIDVEARAALNALLARCRAHGLIA